MRTGLYLWIVGLCSLNTGCTVYPLIARNLAYESALRTNEALECFRDRRLAGEAWDQVQKEHSEHTYSKDYACGFKDGYADYLMKGGTGAPPPLPPRRYWTAHYETPQGHQAIHDWFAGFQHGAAAAKDSGRRELITLPFAAAAPEVLAGHPPPAVEVLPPAPGVVPELPFPRTLPPPPEVRGPATRKAPP